MEDFNSILEIVLMNKAVDLSLKDLVTVGCVDHETYNQIDSFLPYYFSTVTPAPQGRVLSKCPPTKHKLTCDVCEEECDQYDPFTKKFVCHECCTPTISKTDAKKTWKLNDDQLKTLDSYQYKHGVYKTICSLYRLQDVTQMSLIVHRTRDTHSVLSSPVSQAKLKRIKVLDDAIRTLPDEVHRDAYTLDVCVSYLKNGKGGIRKVTDVLGHWNQFALDLATFPDRRYMQEGEMAIFKLFVNDGFSWDGIRAMGAASREKKERSLLLNDLVKTIFGPMVIDAPLGPLRKARNAFIATGDDTSLRALYGRTCRAKELTDILQAYAINVMRHRNDTACIDYIVKGKGDVDTIVENLFWNSYTLYPILSRRYIKLELRKAQQEIQDMYGTITDKVQYNELLESYFHRDKAVKRAKTEAIANYKSSGQNLNNVPKQVLTYLYT
jgi:hypothetical protein